MIAAASDDPVILICAAGGSTRMGPGRDKLLEPVAGVALVRLVAQRALATGLPVMVTLAPDRPARNAVLSDLPLQPICVTDAASGMAASFRAGVAAAGPAPALMTLLGDMPELTTPDLMTVLTAWRDSDKRRPLRATDETGTPGQPVIFPRALFADLAALKGDEGGRRVLGGRETILVPLPGRRATTDLDTPEDWAAWRKSLP